MARVILKVIGIIWNARVVHWRLAKAFLQLILLVHRPAPAVFFEIRHTLRWVQKVSAG